jgi:DNA-binding IclR family transcriptional regulator
VAKRAGSPRPTGPPEPQYPIESVRNALRVLMMLGVEQDLRTVDISRRLGVAPSTGHRLISMLQYFELAEQDKRTKGYHAGPALIDLSLRVIETANPSARALRLLDDLAERSQETVTLGVLRGSDVLIVNTVESPRAVRVGSLAGARYPAHLAAIGKVLLAELPDERVDELFPRAASGDRPSAASVRRDLRAVQARGYATNAGDTGDEVGAIAVPVPDPVGWAGTSLGLSMPLSRFRKAKITELVRMLQETAVALVAQRR